MTFQSWQPGDVGEGIMRQVFTGAQIFDGTNLHDGMALVVEDGVIADIRPARKGDIALDGGILAPAFVDLQVNGGGGIMLDGNADAGRIAAICATHILLGCAGVLPTLITDTPKATSAVIAAGMTAAQANVPGFLGLHLEGPHLDPSKKGAHDPALIRPMTESDLAQLIEAARNLPALKITVAPNAVTPGQIAAMTRAGIVVSLGHSNCTYDEAGAAIAAGAACATHLFNAMSQLNSREPGLVGAVLNSDIAAGIIADGIHVSPVALRIAMAARPKGLFLVSDCMSFAGTDLTEIDLAGRTIHRRNGRLTLKDGNLAGADLRLDQAIARMVRRVGVPVQDALAMATSVPAALIGMSARLGHLLPGRRADMVWLNSNWELENIWWGGVAL
jgi:N-acetylglucosamine-6-phosphate deacetylase